MFVSTAAVSLHYIVVGENPEKGDLNVIGGSPGENVLLAVVCYCM